MVVVGAGQAGLAIEYFLAEQGRGFTILDAADEPAAAWRGRWDSLRLFTPVRNLGLTWQHTRGSALLGWVKDDAEYLARRVSAFRQGAPVQPLTHGDQPTTTGEQREHNPTPVPD